MMGLADEFTVEMASAVTRMPDAEQVLLALTRQNAFVTRLPDGESFRFHHMMKECAERLFAQLPARGRRPSGNGMAAGTRPGGSICPPCVPTKMRGL